ncbi:MAG: 50S ribosomal protein L9, partial [Acidobacteriota bacterium]
ILLERVEKLGQMGDVVKVKPGYARNYLLPQKKALRATKENLAYFEQQHVQLETANLELRKEAEAVARRIEGLSIVLVRQASDMGQLYGSIRPHDIAESVNAAGVTIQRSQVKVDHPIKTIGLHKVRIALHPEVAVEITANVARSEEEAELQAKGEMPTAQAGAESGQPEAVGEAGEGERAFGEAPETAGAEAREESAEETEKTSEQADEARSGEKSGEQSGEDPGEVEKTTE